MENHRGSGDYGLRKQKELLGIVADFYVGGLLNTAHNGATEVSPAVYGFVDSCSDSNMDESWEDIFLGCLIGPQNANPGLNQQVCSPTKPRGSGVS